MTRKTKRPRMTTKRKRQRTILLKSPPKKKPLRPPKRVKRPIQPWKPPKRHLMMLRHRLKLLIKLLNQAILIKP